MLFNSVFYFERLLFKVGASFFESIMKQMMDSSTNDGIQSWIEYEKILNIVIPKQTEEQKNKSALPEGVRSWVEYETVLNIVLPPKDKLREMWKLQDVAKERIVNESN